ncbi:unnamed protein product [Urochloa humidicola]
MQGGARGLVERSGDSFDLASGGGGGEDGFKLAAATAGGEGAGGLGSGFGGVGRGRPCDFDHRGRAPRALDSSARSSAVVRRIRYSSPRDDASPCSSSPWPTASGRCRRSLGSPPPLPHAAPAGRCHRSPWSPPPLPHTALAATPTLAGVCRRTDPTPAALAGALPHSGRYWSARMEREM